MWTTIAIDAIIKRSDRKMPPMNPLSLVLIGLAGLMNQQQQVVIEYLQEEIRVLKEQLGKRPRFNEEQRRRLAVKGKSVGRKGLLSDVVWLLPFLHVSDAAVCRPCALPWLRDYDADVCSHQSVHVCFLLDGVFATYKGPTSRSRLLHQGQFMALRDQVWHLLVTASSSGKTDFQRW
jgi:hypothetical protein